MEQFLQEMLTINAKAQMATILEYIVDLRERKPVHTIQGLARTFELCKKEYDEYAEYLSEVHSPISQFKIDRIWDTQLEQLRKMLRLKQ